MVNKSSKNNIIVITSSFSPVFGGVQTVAKEITSFIQNKKWNVTLITNRYPRKLKKKDIIDNLLIYRLVFLHSPLNYIKSFRFDLVFAWMFFKPITCIKLIFLFFKIKPKVVHVHFPDNQIFEILLLKKIFKFKLILSIHGNDIGQMESINQNNLKYNLFQKLLDESSLITTCSNYLKNSVLDVFPKSNKKKFETLHNGVSDIFLNQNFLNKKSRFFFSVGRFVPDKGFDILADLPKEFPGNEFQLGGGNEKEFLYLLPSYYEGLIFLGKLNITDCFNKYRKAKITIIPSNKESYGIVVAEALCCGSPIVATNVGGIPEVIELAKKNLTQYEKFIFDDWVKLVEPTGKSLMVGIYEILGNSVPMDKYLDLIPKIQNEFSWEYRLKNYYKSLINLVSQ